MANYIGLRELSRGLSTYLDQVQRGASFVITRNGKPIAALLPASAGSIPTAAFVQVDD